MAYLCDAESSLGPILSQEIRFDCDYTLSVGCGEYFAIFSTFKLLIGDLSKSKQSHNMDTFL